MRASHLGRLSSLPNGANIRGGHVHGGAGLMADPTYHSPNIY